MKINSIDGVVNVVTLDPRRFRKIKHICETHLTPSYRDMVLDEDLYSITDLEDESTGDVIENVHMRLFHLWFCRQWPDASYIRFMHQHKPLS